MPRKVGQILNIMGEGNTFLCTVELPNPTASSGNAYTFKLPLVEGLVDRAIDLLGSGPVEVVFESGKIVEILSSEPVEDVNIEALVSSIPQNRKMELKSLVVRIIQEEKMRGELTDEDLYTIVEQEAQCDRDNAEKVVEELLLTGVLYIKGGKVGFPRPRYY